MGNWPLLALVVLACCQNNAALATGEARQHLWAPALLDGTAMAAPIPMTAFTPPTDAQAPDHRLEGRIELFLQPVNGGFRTLRDEFDYATNPASEVQQLPPFNFSFVQAGGQLIPATRGLIASEHPHWEWILEPGRVWQESGDPGYSRAALPFSLVERGENCTHNGVMTFLFNDEGSISHVAFQIASETCLYFQFDLWGLATARYAPGAVPGAKTLTSNYADESARRLPTRPIAELQIDYPGASPLNFSGAPVIDPENMTVYGYVIDGVNYVGGCETRQGPYPFCEVLGLPSYSLAKSVIGGLGLMRLEKLYPGISDELITRYVPECEASGSWQGTTFENALDMATGNFTSADYPDDEASTNMEAGFFIPDKHAAKIAFGCKHFPRRAPPGSQWAYHTSDTYVLGTAMAAYLEQHLGPRKDLLYDVLLPWWQPLHLSPTSRVSRRTYDQRAQLFTGYGLILHVDDVAKLASFTNGQVIGQQVDGDMLDAALQRNSEDRGLPADGGRYFYNNGFWGYSGFTSPNCRSPLVLPFMLGYGGINVVLLPNDTVYYYFSDGDRFAWLAAARESDRIKPFCTPRQGYDS